jgi:hypothetical protein
MLEYYKEYFRVFREKAPKECLIEKFGYQFEISPMASSLESCQHFSYLIGENETLLNAGAGASSWVFRKLLKNVYCTDLDTKYLEVVKSIVGGENYIDSLDKCPEVDFVYWDLGHEERTDLMEKGFSLARKAMYIDDCHSSKISDSAFELAKKHNCFICQPVAHDSFGRYGRIIIKTLPFNNAR